MGVAEMVAGTKELVTAEDLLHLSTTSKRYELVKGELIEMTPPGAQHGKIAVRLSRFLDSFVETHDLGEVMVETGFQLEHQPDTVRSPDISFLATAKIHSGSLPEGFIEGAPDLAVEIVSPHDTASQIQDKVQAYLSHGTQLVWVVYPQQRLITIHYPDGTARTLHKADSLDGEGVIPGFSCRVEDIFS